MPMPRDPLLSVLIVAALAETAWIVYLALILPQHYVAQHWALAWVGLDVAQVIMLLGCAWAAWRRRALLIPFSVSAGTLLVLDAWFDVTTARHGAFAQSLGLALGLEVPSAILLFWIARRTVKALAGATFFDREMARGPVRKIHFDRARLVPPPETSETRGPAGSA